MTTHVTPAADHVAGPRRPDAAQWLAAADVHLLCSREDPFPSVVLEAMSAGVPPQFTSAQ